MNHVYRVVYNHSLNCYQAVSELAKGAHKTSTSGAVDQPPPRN